MRQFLLPDLGEGLEEAEIVAWHVTEGDHVVADQPLVSVETDKAVVEVPSPRSGRIARLFGAKGDLVKVGAPFVEFADGPEADMGTVVGDLGHAQERREARPRPSEPAHAGPPRALPAVRALAGKLEVDLASVHGSGPEGIITRADVERAARTLIDRGPAEPLRGMRRAMAQRMAAAHAEVVPASVTDEADIGDWGPAEDITIRLVRAIAAACKAEPSLNAWYMAAAGERRLIGRVDVGIAVDTEGGLIVPVLRNVGERDARDLRAGLDRLRADAAARAIPPDELRGATITLSNFGMIGGRFANLVVVPPQVAIVGAGRTTKRVVVHEDQPAVRRVLPLSLTFDHRVVTGGEAARFLAALRADIERPC
ncbi:MAG TPA: dihydrolipoamide acetyltransferase family protein [Hyphomicrobiaceae bacterium]|jgi:pyruvate dehydrogenase E2 component (dihydrolipoamide acetyltransferase)|nr:dihydrolipoamide acetyltransferase family protein [Hyphomicrobiaceae bacterium]